MNLMINYHDHWWYKAITWLLIVAIIIMISIGAAPPARAIGVLTATMAAAILAVLAGAGIYTVVSGMTSAQIQSWLNDKLNEWDTSRNDGNVFSDLIQNNLISATVRGTLGIGAAAASGISNFITWLKTNLSLTDNSSINVVNNTIYTLNGYQVVVGEIISGQYMIYTSNHSQYTWLYNNKIQVLSPSGGYITYKMPGYNVSYYMNSVGNGWYYAVLDYYNWPDYLPINNISAYDLGLLQPTLGQTNSGLVLNTDVINIPDTTGDKVIGLEVGAFPGATTDEVTDIILDGIIDNTIYVDMTVSDEIVDAQEVYVINELPLSVNTDHHAFGFQLPEITFDFSSIWHYVTDAVTYTSGFISWWVNFFTSVPILTIPLYCAFTLLVVLGAMRRFLL